jgi:hypothetical protein
MHSEPRIYIPKARPVATQVIQIEVLFVVVVVVVVLFHKHIHKLQNMEKHISKKNMLLPCICVFLILNSLSSVRRDRVTGNDLTNLKARERERVS